MADVWDDYGETHVILAMSPEECQAIIPILRRWGYANPHAVSARIDMALCLRDQKGIDLTTPTRDQRDIETAAYFNET